VSLDFPDRLPTGRLDLRRVEAVDIDALLEVNGDPEVTRFLPYPTWRSLQDGEAWFERMQGLVATGTALQLVVVERQHAWLIGAVLLFQYLPEHARAELGYVLGRRHWGQGLMREALQAVIDHAFAALQLHRLEASVDPRNAASNRILQALGFACEGRLRQR